MVPTLKVGTWARSTAGKPRAAAPAAVPAAFRPTFRKVRRWTRDGARRSLIDSSVRGWRSGLAQELLGDDHALDLVRALVDLGDLGVAHEALHRELAGVAVAAEDAHRLGSDGGTRLLERLHRDLEAFALFSQAILHRHLAVAEMKRHRGRAVDAELAL